jgi:hypothetical protein
MGLARVFHQTSAIVVAMQSSAGVAGGGYAAAFCESPEDRAWRKSRVVAISVAEPDQEGQLRDGQTKKGE